MVCAGGGKILATDGRDRRWQGRLIGFHFHHIMSMFVFDQIPGCLAQRMQGVERDHLAGNVGPRKSL